MEKRKLRQWVWLVLVIVAVALVVRVGMLALSAPAHSRAGEHVATTRLMGVAYMVCDVSISSSLILLLITRNRRAPVWAERRLPGHGRWLWHFLVGLTILCYLSLAPTFLFFLIRLRR